MRRFASLVLLVVLSCALTSVAQSGPKRHSADPVGPSGAWRLLSPAVPPLIQSPSDRMLHTATFDPVGRAMYVIGGLSGPIIGDVWKLDLAGTSGCTEIHPAGALPPRRDHVTVYDPVRHRMLVFGGSGSSEFLNDTWALSLGGAPTWTPVGTVGAPPAARFAHAAIYDPVRDRMIVFGGYNGVFRNDLWALSLSGTPTWTPLTTAGFPPVGRNAMTAIYDPVRDRMLVFGGWDGTNFRGDLWSLNLSSATPAWVPLPAVGLPPSPRRHYQAAYDPGRDRIVLFSGYNFAGFPSDTWELRLSGTLAWAPVAVLGPPPGRNGGRAIYDVPGDRMVMFGGYSDEHGYWGDTWFLAFSGAPAWTPLAPPPPHLPSARRDHTAILDPIHDRLVVFGGWDGSPRSDLWALTLADPPAWSPISSVGTAPAARFSHAAAYDSHRGELIMFGGYGGSGWLNDVWALPLAGSPVWRSLTPAGPAPSPRNALTAIYDEPRDRLVLFGGFDGTEYSDQVWALNLSGSPVWTLLSARGPDPAPRRHYFAAYDPDEESLVLFGGYNGGTTIRNGGYLDDTWVLEFGDHEPKWKKRKPHVAPSARFSGRGGYDPRRQRMVMIGGYDGNYLNDAWELGDRASRWAALSPVGGPPAPRVLHTATFDVTRDRVLVFGGEGLHNERFGDVWALEFGEGGSLVRSAPPVSEEPKALAAVPLVFAVHGVAPNPSAGPFGVSFTLPAAGSAALEVFSVNGRRVAAHEVGSLGPGRHTMRISERLDPGIYWVRVTRGHESNSVKVAVLR